MSETTGERFRRLGDQLRELTNGEHYFSGVAELGKTTRLYMFSFGAFTDSAVAEGELQDRLRIAREAQSE